MSSIASGSSLIAAASALTPDRAAAELLDDGEQEPAVDLVEAVRVDLEQGEGVPGDRGGDRAVRAHLGEVAHAAQQAVGDARRAAAAARRSRAAPAASIGTPRMRAERVTIGARSASV